MTNAATRLAEQLRALLAVDAHGVPAATMSDVMRAQAEAVLLSCGNVAAIAQDRAARAVQWITWQGGACPVEPHAIVEYRLRDGRTGANAADTLWWHHNHQGDDLLAFRLAAAPPAPEEAQP